MTVNKIKCKKKHIYAYDTENDWNEEETEVYFSQCAIVGHNFKDIIEPTGQGIVVDRCAILDRLFEIAMEQEGCTFFYCANLKHEAEFLKEGFKVVQEFYNITYLRRDNQMLQISIKIDEKHMIYFRDILSLYPSSSVKTLGHLFKMEKLEGFNFVPGWSKDVDFSLSENIEYVTRDAEIVYTAARTTHDDGFDGVTLSSVAWKKCKEMFNGGNPANSVMWDRLFPKLSKQADDIIRRAYMGGINFSNPNFIVPENSYLVHDDASSMYPTVGIFDPLPYGEPFFYTKKPDGLYIVQGTFNIKKKYGGIDFLQIDLKPELVAGGYDLVLTSIDYELMHDCYTVESETIDYYIGFSSRVGILKDWFLYWYEQRGIAKANDDPVGDSNAKRMLNALTGRFGLRRELKSCILEDDWISDVQVDDDGEIVENDDSYVPYVAFMTAHARRRLIAHSKLFHPLIHMDTDSCIGYRKAGETTLSCANILGGWKVEHLPVKMVEGGFKRYVEYLKYPIKSLKSINMACAGVPQKCDNNGCPIGMWLEILDNPDIITVKGYELGKEEFCVQSEWLRNLLTEHGYNPDKMDTRKLMPKKAFGGYIYIKTTMKLNDGLQLRGRFR